MAKSATAETVRYTRLCEHARHFEALGYPVRLLLFALIIEGEGTLNVQQLEAEVEDEIGRRVRQSSISHHLALLVGAGLIEEGGRSGAEIYYRVRAEALIQCMDALTMLAHLQR